jgi:chromosome partitioning protein
VKRGVPPSRLLYVLSRISTDAEARAARDYLADAGYAVAAGYLPERAAYRATQDVGRSLVEVRIKSLKVAADEVVQAVIDAIPGPEGEGAK